MWQGVAAPAAAAVLWVAAFPPFEQVWAGWVCLVPLMLAVRAGKADWRHAWAAGTAAWVGTVWWLGYVTVPGMLLLAMYLGGYWAAWAWVWDRLSRRFAETTSRGNLAAAALGACAWTGLEWARGWMFSGFPWTGLGVSQFRNIGINQIAALGGVELAGWLLAFANGVFALTLVRLKREAERSQRLRPHLDFSLTMALAGGAFLWGVSRYFAPAPPARDLAVGFVQGNVPQAEKFEEMAQAEILERHVEATHLLAAANPDLILWPETATGTGMFQDRALTAAVMELAEGARHGLLIGALDYDGRDYYNAAFAFPPGEGRFSVYRKEHLVPFGEFIPGRRWFPWLGALVPLPLDYRPGNGGGVLAIGTPAGPVRAGVLICFEDVFPGLAGRRAAAGAELLVNLTNDAWFRESPAAWQHAAIAVFRSIETGLPMVRCSNHGVTCVIDRLGRIVRVLEDDTGRAVGVRGTMLARVAVPERPAPTPWARGGRYFGLLCAVAGAAFAATELRRRPRA